MFISTNSFALSGTPSLQLNLNEVYSIETGTYYAYSYDYQSDSWYSIVFVPNNGTQVSFVTTSNNEDNDEIYSLLIDYSADTPISNYIIEGMQSLHSADITRSSDFVVTSSNDTDTTLYPQRRDSVQADLYADLSDIYGERYEDELYTFSSYPNVDSITVHHDLVFRLEQEDDLFFEVGTTLSTAAVMLSRYTKSSIRLSIVSIALGVVGEIITSGQTVDVYKVTADFGRWTTINDSSYMYTITNKIYEHCGINARGNEDRAYIVDESPEPIYVPNISYYYDLTAQADDAYAAYMAE